MNLLENPDRGLELSGHEMKRLIALAMDRIDDFLKTMPEKPACSVDGGKELARSLAEPLPRQGMEFSEILELFFERLVYCAFNTTSPGFMAYVPGGGIFHAALADLISDTTNRYVGVWLAAPGLVQLESNVIRWFCQIMGYPAGSGGVLTTGGSLSNLLAVATARRERLPENFLNGILYVSSEVHHSVQKAAVFAGFPVANIREVDVDKEFRMNCQELERMIGEDRRAGKVPFLLVASAGTVNSGAVDDLEELAAVCRREQLWFHVDAAYGGFFMLTERGRSVMKGIEKADSITLDPHKGLFLPYGTGCLLVRDQESLRRAHSVDAAYLPTLQEDRDLVDFCEVSPELSRDFRGLRVWLPLKLHGIAPFERYLEEKLELAAWAARELAKIKNIEVSAWPQLSLLAFRFFQEDVEGEELNRLNRLLLEKINRCGRVFLTPTMLKGSFVIRVCILSFRTHLDRLKECIEEVRRAIRELESRLPQG